MTRFGQSMTRKTCLAAAGAALLGAALVGTGSPASAATVAHWEFEGANFLTDSSGNGHTLTPEGAVAQSGGAAALSGGSLSAADAPGWTGGAAGTQLSVEATINFDGTGGATQVIAGHFGAAPNRSWFLGVVGNSTLRFFTDVDGSNTAGTRQWNTAGSTLSTLTAGKNYYVAAVMDFTEGTDITRAVTFYLKNLTDDTAIETVTITQASVFNALIDSAAPLVIGKTGTGTSPFLGQIGEVRISDTKLSESQLYIIPEPASLGLLALGALAAIGRRRAA